nr:sigma-70 family RNA polymerase sigma factor [Sunxiuqinia sp.]
MRDSKNNSIDFLWNAFLRGDDKSFSAIYQQHIEAMFSYGYKLSADREIVHDCIQEIFIDLFLKREKVNVRIENLKSYLFVALRNCIGKKMSKKRRFEPIRSGEESNDISFQTEYSFQDKLIELEISGEIKKKLQTAVNSLPDRQKEIIYLKFEEEMDYSEIADILKISVESARKLLYRSLLSLRKIVDPAVVQTLFAIFFRKKSIFMSMF